MVERHLPKVNVRGSSPLTRLVSVHSHIDRLLLDPFERDRAIECLDQGLAVIPLWFDQIHHQLRLKLKSSTS